MNVIKQIRKENNLSQSEFAKILNVHQTAVSQWENGRTTPDISSAKLISQKFGISLDIILGDIYTLAKEKYDLEHPHKRGIKIPVLGNVAAGIPIEAIEDIVDYEEISEEMAMRGDFFGLKIKGSSMEPRIKEGDVVIVRQQPEVESGDVAIVIVNGDSATCKKVVINDNGITLIPFNPAFEPIFYSAEQVDTLPVRIIGKVVELRGKF